MFTVSRRKRLEKNEEVEEANMASRLELELGNWPILPPINLAEYIADEEAEAKKAPSFQRVEVLDFRGIRFTDWLALAMEVRFPYLLYVTSE